MEILQGAWPLKVTIFSNFLKHYQLQFCKAMIERLGEGFRFVATEPIPQDRLDLGFKDMNKDYPFVVTTYSGEEARIEAMRLCMDSDVIITGSAPEEYTIRRIQMGKLTFRYSERIYKRGLWRVMSPRGFVHLVKNHLRYRNKPLYMLCVSAYTASDFAMTGNYLGKTYKWGYFSEVKDLDLSALMAQKRRNESITILWAGRLIGWKHPCVPILMAERLKQDNVTFQMHIIGTGELEGVMRNLIIQKRLDDCVQMLGPMSPDKVREHMEAADIFMFTSDFNEGWGVVLNEAMSSGCAVIANHAIGSVPFLLRDGENGLIYKNGDMDDLYFKLRNLIGDGVLRQKLGMAAYDTLSGTWNAEVAVDRFLKLCDALQQGKKSPFADGPCSRAEVVFQHRMYDSLTKQKKE